MRFLVDECSGPHLARFLEHSGHDVFCVSRQSPGDLDENILFRARKEERIIITNDKDFGQWVFQHQRPHCGVIFLRLAHDSPPIRKTVVAGVIQRYGDQLKGAFVVATENIIRFARQTAKP